MKEVEVENFNLDYDKVKIDVTNFDDNSTKQIPGFEEYLITFAVKDENFDGLSLDDSLLLIDKKDRCLYLEKFYINGSTVFSNDDEEYINYHLTTHSLPDRFNNKEELAKELI